MTFYRYYDNAKKKKTPVNLLFSPKLIKYNKININKINKIEVAPMQRVK